MEVLQIAILKKVGEYGEDIKKIAEGLEATQDSFSKMINPILDKRRDDEEALNKTGSNKEIPKEKRKKSQSSFEDYLK
jgi:predicted CopG family antitoxin